MNNEERPELKKVATVTKKDIVYMDEFKRPIQYAGEPGPRVAVKAGSEIRIVGNKDGEGRIPIEWKNEQGINMWGKVYKEVLEDALR